MVVTGGVAAGKTTFCQFFQQAVGAVVVFDCDACVHDLLTRGDIKDRLRAEFGDAVFASNHEVDRSSLGRIVFEDADSRRILEGILHPEVLKRCLEARESALHAGEAPVFLADVPLFYEVEFSLGEDLVVVVAASRSIRVRRLMERGVPDEDYAERIISTQLPLKDKINRADRVLWNESDVRALRRQVHYLASLEIEEYGK
ncbi:MAG: dephospho-CoA kinase [Verrucomicrobiales bacterium]